MQKIFILMLITLLAAAMAAAQDTSGKIVGTVSAADGVIPGAVVTATDKQTGKERTVTASSDGTFEIPQLEFGTYTVKVSAGGFKTLTVSDVKISAGREYPLNPQLEVGQVAEVVTVTAGTQEINATNAELSTTITQEQVRELPLNGRNPLSLLNLTAGAKHDQRLDKRPADISYDCDARWPERAG